MVSQHQEGMQLRQFESHSIRLSEMKNYILDRMMPNVQPNNRSERATRGSMLAKSSSLQLVLRRRFHETDFGAWAVMMVSSVLCLEREFLIVFLLPADVRVGNVQCERHCNVTWSKHRDQNAIDHQNGDKKTIPRRCEVEGKPGISGSGHSSISITYLEEFDTATQIMCRTRRMRKVSTPILNC